jgi:hypothetical protein
MPRLASITSKILTNIGSKSLPIQFGIGSYWPEQGGYFAGTIDYSGGSGTQVYNLVLSDKSSETLIEYGSTNGLSSTSAFDGFLNTQAINNSSYPAAQYARSLSLNGFTDWYIPAYFEMQILLYNFKPHTGENFIGSNTEYGSYGINPYSVPPTLPYTETSPAQNKKSIFRADGSQAFDNGAVSAYWTSTQRGGIFTSQNYTGIFRDSNYGQFGSLFKDSVIFVRTIRKVAVV